MKVPDGASANTTRWGRSRLLVGVWGRIVGPVALRRALPTYAALLLVGVVFFVGEQAMRPRELTGTFGASARGRVLALVGWCLISWPVARAVLLTPQLGYLRTLALPRSEATGAALVWLLAVELPWAALWLAGAGVLGSLHAALSASAVHATAASGLGLARGGEGRGAPLARAASLVAAAAGIAAGAPRGTLLLVPLLASSLGRVWAEGRTPGGVSLGDARGRWRASAPRALVAEASRRRGSPRGPTWSWSRALVLVLWRAHAGVLVRWLVWSGAVVAGAVLAVQNNTAPAQGPRAEDWAARVFLAFVAAGGLIGTSGLALALARIERAASWWLSVLGLSRERRLLAALGALLVCSAPLALAQSALFGRVCGGASPVVLGSSALGAAALTTLAALGLREASGQGDGRDSGRLIAGLAAGVVAVAVGSFHAGLAGLLAVTATLVVVAFFLSWGRGRRETPATAGRGEA